MDLAELLKKAGITDIVIPRKEFIKEHTHLIRLLKKPASVAMLRREAAAQEKELAGASKASGFIQRMMAENALKHKGQYRNPSKPLASGSTMNKPVAFKYSRLANAGQGGTNEDDYGASPFIQKHFSGKPVPFNRKRQSKWAENYESGVSFDPIAEDVFRPKKGKTGTVQKSEAPAPPPPPPPPKTPKFKSVYFKGTPKSFLMNAPKDQIQTAADTPADQSRPSGDSRLTQLISELSLPDMKEVFRKRFPSDKMPSDDRLSVELMEKLAYEL
jgi:hypothetical protein